MNLEIPLEMVDGGIRSITVPNLFTRVRMRLDPSDYDGATYYFEIVATNEDPVSRDVELMVGDTVKATIEVPANTSSYTRLRSSSFTPSEGANDYDIRLAATTFSLKLRVTTGRIIVKQINATKTRIQIPLVAGGYASGLSTDTGYLVQSTSNDYEQPNARYFSLWKKVVANFADLASGNCWSLEVVLSGNKGTATALAALFNVTDEAMVTGAEVSVLGDTITRIQADFADNAGNFDNLDEFELRIKKSGGGARANLYAGRLYIKLTNLSKAEILYRISKSGSFLASGVDIVHQRVLMDTSLFDDPTIYFEATGKCADNTERVFLRDHSTNNSGANGSDVSDSGINFNSANKIIIRTSALTLISGNRFYTRVDDPTASLELNSVFIIVQAEYVAPPPIAATAQIINA